ncbi:MAG: methyltransferase domain-containing protein [Christensenella sp.]|uniref:hypothetical protein n=1 Tax=Christensenella sp. TaxID=1935934 RepID=UPI002B217B08|nr:hypothetical protein [Christensenella sp.]MEA5004633.1 methyltransferase domain-containing protein [Christensenella sp.]
MFLKNFGYCPCCGQETQFESEGEWLRDDYKCMKCGSLPRERALLMALEKTVPDWHEKTVFEYGSVNREVSRRLAQQSREYGSTAYDGAIWDIDRFQDAKKQYDIIITQEILNQIYDYEQVFQQIAGQLKPGGAHIFTLPLVRKNHKSHNSIKRMNGEIFYWTGDEYMKGEPPLDMRAWEWGYDIVDRIFRTSGLFTKILTLDNLEFGVRAEYIDVMISMKPSEKLQ